MTVTITLTLPDNLAMVLQTRATAVHQTVDEYLAAVLAQHVARLSPASDAHDVLTALNDAVAQIHALPPRKPSSIVRATASLRDLLANAPLVADFDEAAWNRAWTEVEAETNARDRLDPLPSGRTS